MYHKHITQLLLGMLVSSHALAQDVDGERQSPCIVEPVFHCAEHMDDGSYIGHFGYRAHCPESDKPVEDVFVEIGDDNSFTPAPVDRGQPTIFLPGEHVDEFESEFTAKEIEKGEEFVWSVLNVEIPVDFSKSKDGSLDCTDLPY